MAQCTNRASPVVRPCSSLEQCAVPAQHKTAITHKSINREGRGETSDGPPGQCLPVLIAMAISHYDVTCGSSTPEDASKPGASNDTQGRTESAQYLLRAVIHELTAAYVHRLFVGVIARETA